MANSTNPNLDELKSISPATSVAAGNTIDQAKMAMAPAAKQGTGGISNDFINKGNVHVKMAPGLTKVETQEEKDIRKQKYKEIDSAVDINEQQREQVQEQIRESTEIKKLGEAGAALQGVLTANVNRLFNKRAGAIAGSDAQGLAAVAQQEDLMKESTLTADAKKSFSNIGSISEFMKDPTKLPADPELKRKLEEIQAGDPAKREAALNELEAAELGKIADTYGTRDTAGMVQLDWNKINAQFPNKEKFIATLLSTGLADEVVVDDQLLKDMGYDTAEEIADLKGVLGITGQNPTISEFKNKVSNFLDTTFADVRKAEEIVRNPMATFADKQNAINSLRAMGYTGSLVAREDTQRVVQELEDADTGPFTFGGKTYGSIKDALADDNITGLVSNYLTTGESKYLPPELKTVVDDNKAFFESAVAELGDEVSAFNDIQKSNQEIIDAVGDDALLDAIGFGKRAYYTSKADRGKFPQAIQQLLDPTLDQTTKELNKEIIRQVSTIPGSNAATTAKILNKITPEGLTILRQNPTNLTNYINGITTNNAVKRVKEKMAGGQAVNPAEVLSTFYGADAPTMYSDFVTLSTLSRAGIPVPGNPLDVLVNLGDIRDPVALANVLDEMIVDDEGDVVGVMGATPKIQSQKNSFSSAIKDNPTTRTFTDLASIKDSGDFVNFAKITRRLPGNENDSDIVNAAKASKLAEQLGAGTIAGGLENVIENHYRDKIIAPGADLTGLLGEMLMVSSGGISSGAKRRLEPLIQQITNTLATRAAVAQQAAAATKSKKNADLINVLGESVGEAADIAKEVLLSPNPLTLPKKIAEASIRTADAASKSKEAVAAKKEVGKLAKKISKGASKYL